MVQRNIHLAHVTQHWNELTDYTRYKIYNAMARIGVRMNFVYEKMKSTEEKKQTNKQNKMNFLHLCVGSFCINSNAHIQTIIQCFPFNWNNFFCT